MIKYSEPPSKATQSPHRSEVVSHASIPLTQTPRKHHTLRKSAHFSRSCSHLQS